MTPIITDYRTAKAPGAIVAIVFTLAVNIGLFAVLSWVNHRPTHLENAAAMVKAHRLKLQAVPPVRPLVKEFKVKEAKQPREEKVKPRLNRRITARPPALKRPPIAPQQISVSLNLPEIRFAPTISDVFDTSVPSSPDPGLVQGDGIADESEVDTPPHAVYSPSPHYPLTARRLGHTGRVKLSLIITREGRARDLQVLHSSGHRSLDESALRTVWTWRFEPALDQGASVDVRGTIQINFQIDRN